MGRRIGMTHDNQMRIAAAEAQGWTGPWRFGSTHLHGTPPNAEKPATDWTNDEHVPEKVDALVHQLCNTIFALALGIEAVRSVINESAGVAGLHMNGDVAKWGDLEFGGRFDEWLSAFNGAEAWVQNADNQRAAIDAKLD